MLYVPRLVWIQMFYSDQFEFNLPPRDSLHRYYPSAYQKCNSSMKIMGNIRKQWFINFSKSATDEIINKISKQLIQFLQDRDNEFEPFPNFVQSEINPRKMHIRSKPPSELHQDLTDILEDVRIVNPPKPKVWIKWMIKVKKTYSADIFKSDR